MNPSDKASTPDRQKTAQQTSVSGPPARVATQLPPAAQYPSDQRHANHAISVEPVSVQEVAELRARVELLEKNLRRFAILMRQSGIHDRVEDRSLERAAD